MPYIDNKQIRQILDDIVYKYFTTLEKKGNLNYFLCKLFLSTPISYEHARNFIGELENAKLEIYRRFIAPYEDIKCKENGDL